VEGRDFVEGISGDDWVLFNILLMIGRLSTAVVLYIQERGIYGLTQTDQSHTDINIFRYRLNWLNWPSILYTQIPYCKSGSHNISCDN